MFTHGGDAGNHHHIQRRAYNHTNDFVYFGGNVNHNADLYIEVDRHTRNAWCSFRKYTLGLYERPSGPLELKNQMLRAEILEILLQGCVTWSPRACHYDTLHGAHHRFLTRCIGWQKNSRAHHPISYLDTLINTGEVRSSRRLCAEVRSCKWKLWCAWRTRDCRSA